MVYVKPIMTPPNPQKAKWREGARRVGRLAEALYAAQDGKCFHCGDAMLFDEAGSRSRTKGWSREHVFPRSGKLFLPNNIVLAHPRCNNLKGDRAPTLLEISKTKKIYERLGLIAFLSPRAFATTPTTRTKPKVRLVSTPAGIQWVTVMNEQMVVLDKLRIENGVIHYRLQQQDGQMQPMTCADTPSNRMFVAWVQIHDGFIPKSEGAPRAPRPEGAVIE